MKLPDADYFKARLVNTLEYPHIAQWVGSFMAEINASIAAPILYDASKYFVRFEWGPNGNIHSHSLLMSDKLSKEFICLKKINLIFYNDCKSFKTYFAMTFVGHQTSFNVLV